MSQLESSERSGTPGARVDLLMEVRDALGQLRNRLTHQVSASAVVEMRREIDALVARIEHDLGSSAAEGARARFEQALALQPAFERVIRTWGEFRSVAGLEAARDILADSDNFKGWEDRWGALFDVAWLRRTTLEMAPRSAGWVTRPRASDTGGLGRPRIDRADQVLALDLRYAAAMPLAQIAELLNLSPAAVQIRLSEFEDSVLEAAAADVIKRQVPEGWRLLPLGSERRSDELVLVRQQGQAKTEISLRIIPVWTERELGAGRPRSANRMVASRPARRRLKIWVLVFSDGPRVRFLPEGRLRARMAAGDVTVPDLVEVAQESGMDVLADAVREASNVEGGPNA